MSPQVIEESILKNGFVIRNSAGLVTHRIERSTFGDELLVRNVHTHRIETRIRDIF